jgi:hypothetical protein
MKTGACNNHTSVTRDGRMKSDYGASDLGWPTFILVIVRT